MCKQRMRLGCNRSKIDLTLHTGLRFRHRTSIQDRYVYTAITDSAVPKNCQYGAKILGCRANFLVRKWGLRILFNCLSKGLFTWREEDPSTRKILEGGTTFRLLYMQKFRPRCLPSGEGKEEK